MKKLLLLGLLITSCAAGDINDVKIHAESVWKENGFQILGYQGYEYGPVWHQSGCVWFTLKKIPDNGITYDGCISKFKGEYHIYNLGAVDAIKPGNRP